ncbi:MAG: sel1 repeat family protein [Kiritimatiellae bacterium]|nr:sel1 repeat family protein [Kiritimatiellia bacterium]
MSKCRYRFSVFAIALIALASFSHASQLDSASAILTIINSPNATSPRQYREAARVVAQDAKKGKPLQQFIIAVKSRDPDFPLSAQINEDLRTRYYSSSRPIIQNMAQNHNKPLAWYLLALDENDMTKLKKAADGGNVQALNEWATMSIDRALSNPLLEESDREKILRKSFEAFRKSATAKDPNGIYNLGICHLQGYGVRPDCELAIDCFKDAAQKGHPEAMNNIGGLYRDGIGVEQDNVIAARWFARSADLGNAYGLLNYAYCLQRGEGAVKDEERAARMFQQSADEGNLEAMNAYALCLLNGSGIEKAPSQAYEYLLKAAEAGFPPAMENLAALLENGKEGVEKNPIESNVWSMRARAIRGDKNAAAWLMENNKPLR